MNTCGDYEILRLIGRGDSGSVYHGQHTKSHIQVALKIFDDRILEEFRDQIDNEVNIISQLDHPNISRYVDSGDAELIFNGRTKPGYYIALELVPGGQLFDYIDMTGAFSEEIARYYFHQLIDVIEYLHDKGISHRDLSPENILLDENHNLKLIDFGYGSNKTI